MKLSHSKSFAYFLFFILVSFLGCTPDTPESIAQDFTQALYSANFKKAKAFCTPETQEGIDMIASMCEGQTDAMKDAKTTVEVTECKLSENGEEATVYLNVKNRMDLMRGQIDNDVKQEKVRLVKQDGKWLVNFKVK